MAEDESPTEAAGRSTDDVGKAAALPKTNFLGRIHNGAGVAAVLIVSLGDDDDDPPRSSSSSAPANSSLSRRTERAIVHPDNDVFWVGREGGA